MGEAPYPFQTPFGKRYQMVPVEIDEKVLSEVAKITDGEYYRATNNKKLEEIYNIIDTLEKTRVEVTSFRKAKELFYVWLASGLFLVTLIFFIIPPLFLAASMSLFVHSSDSL